MKRAPMRSIDRDSLARGRPTEVEVDQVESEEIVERVPGAPDEVGSVPADLGDD